MSGNRNKKQKLTPHTSSSTTPNNNNLTTDNNTRLEFNINTFSKQLKHKRITQRVGHGAAVYITAVLQYLTTELIDSAAIQAKKIHNNQIHSDNHNDIITITPEHIDTAIANDNELLHMINECKQYKQLQQNNNNNNDDIGSIAPNSIHITDSHINQHVNTNHTGSDTAATTTQHTLTALPLPKVSDIDRLKPLSHNESIT